MGEGCDYSYQPPTPAELRAAGKRFVVRYVSTPGHAKNLTAGERARLQAAGIAIVVVCQVTSNDALDGAARGRERMRSAIQQVKDLGGPADSVIYMVADFDVQPAQVPACLAYVRGAAEVRGHRLTGLYGGRRIIEAARAARVCAYLWQTYAWSGRPTVWVPGTHLQQYRNNVPLGSGVVDLDRSTAADYGQWRTTVANAEARGWGPPCPTDQIVGIEAGGRRFNVHRKVAPIFKAFIGELVDRGYPIDRGTLDDWSYVCRHIGNDPSRPWSNHAWGLAIDINSLTNPMRSPLTTDMPAWVRNADDLLVRYGLRWGGTYRMTPDPMHFEFMGTPSDADRIAAQLTQPEDPMPTEAETKRAVQQALAAERDATAQAIAAQVAASLEPLLKKLSGSPHVFIRKPDDNTIYVLTPAGPVHVPNPAMFGVLSGDEGIDAATIEVPPDDPIWG